MGRFARNRSAVTGREHKVKVRLVAPSNRIRSWTTNKSERNLQHKNGNNLEIKAFKLVMLILLLAAGVSSGWGLGRALTGTSTSGMLQSAAVLGTFPQQNIAVPQPGKDAEGNQNATDQQPASEDGQALYQGGTPQRTYSNRGRRYSKGRSFQPTSIVTKPARAISKPFKKLNPFKLF